MSDEAQALLRLDPDRLAETADQLQYRVEERFPGSGLAKVAAEVRGLAKGTRERLDWIAKPNWLVRGVCWGLIVVLAVTLFGLLIATSWQTATFTGKDLLEITEAAIQDLVFVGVAVWFLLTFENRLKRKRVIKATHEIRSLMHLIDVHQLTKDPHVIGGSKDGSEPTKHSPKRDMTPFQMGRYLDYCSEMLSILAKVAAVYVEEFPDAEAADAVTDIESLGSGLSRKIWQKIVILDGQQSA